MNAPADALSVAAEYLAATRARFDRFLRQSLHLTMRDGARIAVDLYLPRDLGGAKLPAIVRQTRYGRSLRARGPLSLVVTEQQLDPINARIRRVFLERGYAWVDVDVRGSGASFSSWPMPWGEQEVKDGAEIVDWVVAQPWSSGLVGATGNSYDGTAAEMLLINQHPAVRAIAPRCSLYDVYADIAFPGGLHQRWFTESWTRLNQALDANRPGRAVAEIFALAHPTFRRGLARRALELGLGAALAGVPPVDGDRRRALLLAAIAEHSGNRDIHASALQMSFRDDVDPTAQEDGTMDRFSPSAHLAQIRGAGAAVYSIGAWFDGAYPGAAVKRHLALGGAADRLLLGPWNHGVRFYASPHNAGDRQARFDLAAELLRFFDHHLQGRATGIESEPAVRYFSMGDERWREASRWPPPSVTPLRWYLGPQRALCPDLPEHHGADEYQADLELGSGHRSRWRTLVSPFVDPDYPARAEAGRRSLIYRSAPLPAPLLVSGSPRVVLFLRSRGEDGALFAYLEEEAPDGRVCYLGEGMLRLIHRDASKGEGSFTRARARPMPIGEVAAVEVEMLPLAHHFAAGSRIRLALAAADRDHFTAPPNAGWAVARGPDHPSCFELPIERSPEA